MSKLYYNLFIFSCLDGFLIQGEQLVNHIPNGNLLTTKIGLLTSLQEFDRVTSKVGSPNRRLVGMFDLVSGSRDLSSKFLV